MVMPNFLIIGAEKCGTSSLYNWLKQHPQIHMSPVKEPRFFLFDGEEPDFSNSINYEGAVARYKAMHSISVTNMEEYCTLFQGVTDHKAIGEASVHYLYNPRVPARIRHYIPDAKLIAILRDPVERAYSNYFLDLAVDTKLPFYDFAGLIREEEMDAENIWQGDIHYVRKGFYYAQLKPYLETFNNDQIKIYLYEDLKNDPIGLMQDIFRFLAVDDTFIPDSSRKYNVSFGYRIRVLHDFINFLASQNPLAVFFKFFFPKKLRRKVSTNLSNKNRNYNKPPLPPEVRGNLINIYKEDILKLQDLIQRDLSMWLKI